MKASLTCRELAMPNLRDITERLTGGPARAYAAEPDLDLRDGYDQRYDHDGYEGYDERDIAYVYPDEIEHDGVRTLYEAPNRRARWVGGAALYERGSRLERYERRTFRRRARTLAVITFAVGVIVGIAIEALRADDAPSAAVSQPGGGTSSGGDGGFGGGDPGTRPLDQIHVLSVNGESGVAGQATGMGNRLRAVGYTAIDATAGPKVDQTIVYSWPGYEPDCVKVADFVAQSRNEAVRLGALDGSVTNAVPAASDAHCVVVIGPPQTSTVTFETGPSVASVS
jgi:hypothetical protein